MPNIIIADDDPDYAKDLGELLVAQGYIDPCLAPNCRAMLESIARHGPPKAIVLDMMLPENEDDAHGGFPPNNPLELRGLRILPELRKLVNLKRVVVITAFPSQSARDLLVKEGIRDSNILLKPARTSDILRQIQTAINLPAGE